MTKLAHIAAAVVVLVACGSAANAADQRVEVRLYVRDHAGVGSAKMTAAKVRMSKIYATAGVDVVWVDQWDSDALMVTIIEGAAQQTIIDQTHAGDYVMGFAPDGGRNAFVFYDRVSELSDDSSTLLGQVLAHEVGHLLMPRQGHSPDGIMRARMNPAQPRQLTFFTAAQAHMMRVTLTK